MDARQVRGLAIAIGARQMSDGRWLVPSQSSQSSAGGDHVVDLDKLTCTCVDHELTAANCKHILAARYAQIGFHPVFKPEEVMRVRVTYPQDWAAYNAAQTREKERFQWLLRSLCAGIIEPPPSIGRPRLPLADGVYAAVLKVYTTFSGRRATTDIRDSAGRGLMRRAPSYNSLFEFIANPALAPLLKTLVEESAAPLKAIETAFAVDATGFGTSVFSRWFDHRYGRPAKERRWLKLHAMCGVRTNIITALEVTEGEANECPLMPGLVKTTAERFRIEAVSGDKAYLSYENVDTIAEVGGVPYIPLKSNTIERERTEWKRLWHLFWYRRAEFLKGYHQRSNVESTFSMIKRKFGGSVRSKKFEAQVNEVLCKVIAHNLVVLVHEMEALGIAPEFWTDGEVQQ